MPFQTVLFINHKWLPQTSQICRPKIWNCPLTAKKWSRFSNPISVLILSDHTFPFSTSQPQSCGMFQNIYATKVASFLPTYLRVKLPLQETQILCISKVTHRWCRPLGSIKIPCIWAMGVCNEWILSWVSRKTPFGSLLFVYFVVIWRKTPFQWLNTNKFTTDRYTSKVCFSAKPWTCPRGLQKIRRLP